MADSSPNPDEGVDSGQAEREEEANRLGVPVEDLDSLRFGALVERANLMLKHDIEGALQLEKRLGMDFLDASRLPPELRKRYRSFVKNEASRILAEDVEIVNRAFELKARSGEDLPVEIFARIFRLASFGLPIEQIVKEGPAAAELRRAYAMAISIHTSGMFSADMAEVGRVMGQFLERIPVLRAKIEKFTHMMDRVRKGEIPAGDPAMNILMADCAQMATELKILGIEGSDIFPGDSEADKIGRKLLS